MAVSIAYVLGAIVALAGTVLSLIFITPDKKREKLPKIFQIVHDIFNFKFLILEKILKCLYIFSTLFCLGGGFFMLFSGYRSYSYFGGGSFESLALQGLLVMILGPVAVRIAYEFLMLAILAVKNIIELNNKTKNQNGEAKDDLFDIQANIAAPAAEEVVPVVKEDWGYCTACGTHHDRNKGACPNCGK